MSATTAGIPGCCHSRAAAMMGTYTGDMVGWPPARLPVAIGIRRCARPRRSQGMGAGTIHAVVTPGGSTPIVNVMGAGCGAEGAVPGSRGASGTLEAALAKKPAALAAAPAPAGPALASLKLKGPGGGVGRRGATGAHPSPGSPAQGPGEVVLDAGTDAKAQKEASVCS